MQRKEMVCNFIFSCSFVQSILLLSVLNICIELPRPFSIIGKLRILYECFPMAIIMEQAGGSASTGMFRGEIKRLLELVPTTIHEKCPIIIGCNRDVNKVLEFYKEN